MTNILDFTFKIFLSCCVIGYLLLYAIAVIGTVKEFYKMRRTEND